MSLLDGRSRSRFRRLCWRAPRMEMGRFMSRKAGKGSLVRAAFLNDEAARRDISQEFGVPVDGDGFICRKRSFQRPLYPDVFHADGSCDQHRRLFSTTILWAQMEPEMCWSVLILQTPRHRKSPEALPYKTRSRHSMFSPFRSALACTVTLPQVCTLVRCVLLCKMTSSSLIYAEQWLHLAETAVAGTEVLLRQEKHSTSRAGAGLLSAVGECPGRCRGGWLIFPEGAVLIRGRDGRWGSWNKEGGKRTVRSFAALKVAGGEFFIPRQYPACSGWPEHGFPAPERRHGRKPPSWRRKPLWLLPWGRPR